jgi:hypothetical protein
LKKENLTENNNILFNNEKENLSLLIDSNEGLVKNAKPSISYERDKKKKKNNF